MSKKKYIISGVELLLVTLPLIIVLGQTIAQINREKRKPLRILRTIIFFLIIIIIRKSIHHTLKDTVIF